MVEFLWLQTAISIRHSDSVDVKFSLLSGDTRMEKVIALMHPYLLELAGKAGRGVTDAWSMKLAALHLVQMIETGEDMEKTIVTPSSKPCALSVVRFQTVTPRPACASARINARPMLPHPRTDT